MSSVVCVPKCASTKSIRNRTVGSRARITSRGSKLVVRASENKPNPSVTSDNELKPTIESVAAAKKKEPFAMNFDGFAPEVINGRLAQIGFLAAVGAEVASGESLATQFQTHPVAFGLTAALITAATFMPRIQSATSYTSDPKSIKTEGPFTVDAEMMNGRAAMLGMVALLGTEALKGGALF